MSCVPMWFVVLFALIVLIVTGCSQDEELYSSFHVCEKVNAADFERAIVVLNDTESWPDGALICRYFRPTGPN